LLQSDTFADGENPEESVPVGEKLSREGSPVADAQATEMDQMQALMSPPVPGTPDRGKLKAEIKQFKDKFYLWLAHVRFMLIFCELLHLKLFIFDLII
jgi:hypothetical protein